LTGRILSVPLDLRPFDAIPRIMTPVGHSRQLLFLCARPVILRYRRSRSSGVSRV
jgi:hypothetical protein